MPAVVGIVLLLINLAVCAKDRKAGLLTFIGLSLLSPHLHLAGTILSYELLAFVPVFGIYLVKRPKVGAGRFFLLIYAYIFLLFASSLVSVLMNGVVFNSIAFVGTIRFVILAFLVSDAIREDKRPLELMLLAVLGVNLVFAGIQLTFDSSIHLFYQLYYKPSLTPLAEQMAMGYFNRANGSFGSPLLLGLLSLYAFAYSFGHVIQGEKNNRRILILGISLLTGILSLSKTFLIGIPIIISLGLFLRIALVHGEWIVLNAKTVIYGFIGSVVAIGLGYAGIAFARQKGLVIDHYLSYVYQPFKALASRYDGTEGILSETRIVILDNFLFGVGKTQVAGEFLGDSLYTMVLHDTGIMGVILLLTAFIYLGIQALRRRMITHLLLLSAALLAGIGIPSVFNIFGAIFIGFVLTGWSPAVSTEESRKASLAYE